MCNRNIVALNRIKAIVDAYKEERIHITIGNDDFNDVTHTYDVCVIASVQRQVITQMYYSGSRLQLFLVEYSQEQV